MKWYHYIAAFFAGAFLANTIPHLVNGISGDPFPSPFADPPGKGLSPPVVNVLWAGMNMVIGYILLMVSRLTPRSWLGLLAFLAGFMAMAMNVAHYFADKVKL
jgi:hypothetical protein